MIDRRHIGVVSESRRIAVRPERLVRFAKATNHADPIYFDETAALAAGHPALPAPLSFVFSLGLWAPARRGDIYADLGLDKRRTLHGGQRFHHHHAIYAGDEITLTTKTTDIFEKKGGALEFVVQETEARNQRGDLCVVAQTVTILRHEAEEARSASGGALASPAPGRRLPDHIHGPITRETLALFAEASGDHALLHTDSDFARSAGLADVIAPGMLPMAYLGQLLTHWAPQDRIREWGVRFCAITPLNAVARCFAWVVDDYTAGDERLARLRLGARRDDGVLTMEGDAVIAMEKPASP